MRHMVRNYRLLHRVERGIAPDRVVSSRRVAGRQTLALERRGDRRVRCRPHVRVSVIRRKVPGRCTGQHGAIGPALDRLVGV